MTATRTAPAPHGAARLHSDDCRLADFVTIVDQTPDLRDYPHATTVLQRVLVYDAATLRRATVDEAGRDAVASELVRAFTDGPGVVVIRGAFTDLSVVDRVTAAFDSIIAAERARGTLETLSPGERREFRLELKVLEGADQVAAAIKADSL